MRRMRSDLRCTMLLLVWATFAQAQNLGYYRQPAIYDQTIVFTAEGDLWQVGIGGGVARRLTTHPAEETNAAFSPDGKTIAFLANYEGPTEVYTMPAGGGLPTRRTFDGGGGTVSGWTPDGKILYATHRYSTLPNVQLVAIDSGKRIEVVPLSEAAEGSYDAAGKTLFFTRLPFQGSYTKRYKGGEIQNIWRYTPGSEAVALTADYAGTSKKPMWWNRRVYFLSDRDGAMNLWSMDENGKNLKQHTRHQGWDIHNAALSQGRIVYDLGADLRLYDIGSGQDKAVRIELSSDFDHLREHWVKEPLNYTTAAHISPDGSKVALTARGRIFVAPIKSGRFVEIAQHKPGRSREARFLDNQTLLALSTESGEVEFWKMPANGTGRADQLTTDGKVLRWEGIPSPDGKWVAHQDKDNQLWLLDTSGRTQKQIAKADGSFNDPQFEMRWSPDSRWLAFSQEAANQLNQISLYNVENGTVTPLTTDRYDSHAAAWSRDGKWIYFVSDRSLKSVVMAPWGIRQPEPFFDRSYKIYLVPLKKGLRSPFEPADELHPDDKDAKDQAQSSDPEKNAEKKAGGTEKPEPPKVEIDLDGIAGRLQEVPVPPGNFSDLSVGEKRVCWLDHRTGDPPKTNLDCVDIGNKKEKPETLMEEVRAFELSGDGKKFLVVKQREVYVLDAAVKAAALKEPKTLQEAQVDLKSWTFSVTPADEYHENFLDAWRLHRDYFYDRNMHGVNWSAMRDKYSELLGRVRDRSELNGLIAEMVSELSALHTFVRGGDVRTGPDQVQIGFLGARLARDAEAGGYRVVHIYESDPDRPDRASPLARPGVQIANGDLLLAINGRDLLSVTDPGELLRNQAGKQVLVHYRPKDGREPRDNIVTPIGQQQEFDLRYHEWEYGRRREVERAAHGRIGYIHLRAMGPNDINQWIEEYIPVFRREGLIIDVRHNGGGNIDSWILGRLLRKPWMYWQPRVGKTTWNMQEAFRGHMVVLCDQRTGSDGEAFAEGFRRLGLGKVIGTRTWGGEIWLSMGNRLADNGIASAAELGVFGPEGKWLIEGHGVDPDMTVDNLPHATFEGKDSQLEAAIAHLERLLREKPVDIPAHPYYPDKSLKAPAASR